MTAKHLVWFRSDLRTCDHPALVSACNNAGSSDDVIAVYCLAESQWRHHGLGDRKIAWIKDRVHALKHELAELNIPLVVLNSATFDNNVSDIKKLIGHESVTHIYFNYEYEINEQTRDQALASWCDQHRINHYVFHDQCLIPPTHVRTQTGQPYKVFTPFKRAWSAQYLNETPKAPYPAPTARPTLAKVSTSSFDVGNNDRVRDTFWACDESQAHEQLNDFLDHHIDTYHDTRDHPSLNTTSRCSGYLSIGMLSMNQCFYLALQKNNSRILDGNPGIVIWLSELIWREFYRHLLVEFPRLCKNKAFKVETDKLVWRNDPDAFDAWCQGKTGYPLVDAGMRQLQHEGWMHNRLRMVSAMFLTKHLLIDWRQGEAWFNQWLIDADLASNNGGWQWSASTGADGAPYFRVFNPTTQSQRFDSNGDFIRQYVPELASLNAKSIHEPNSIERAQCQYPHPIVEHKQARLRAIDAFKNLSATE